MKRFHAKALLASVFALALPLAGATAQATPAPFGERVAASRDRAALNTVPTRVLRTSQPASAPRRTAALPSPAVGAHPGAAPFRTRGGEHGAGSVRGSGHGSGHGSGRGSVSVSFGNGRVSVGFGRGGVTCPPVPAPTCGYWETVRERVVVPAVYEWRRDACGRPYRVCVRPECVEWRERQVWRAACHHGCDHQRVRGPWRR